MVVLLQNSNCHARPGSDAKPHCATLGQDLMLFLLKNYKTTFTTLGQDLMVVLLKNRKTALCHAQPGSDGGSVDEPQNRIVPRLARACVVSCCSN